LGGQFGYNWQNGQSVLGVELSGAASWLSDMIVSPFFPESDRERTAVSSLWTATARVGFAADRYLFYIKGGYAGARVQINAIELDGADSTTFAAGKTRHGWTIGGGWEYAFASNWSFGAEFNYLDFGSADYRGFNTEAPPGSERFAVRSTVQSVIARLNYRFGN
jgi:outer membrane immunogenic protein